MHTYCRRYFTEFKYFSETKKTRQEIISGGFMRSIDTIIRFFVEKGEPCGFGCHWSNSAKN